MNLKQFKDQNGFIDITNSTTRSEVVQGIYHEVYPTKIGFETLIPFKTVTERNQTITRKKPMKFTVTTGEQIGEEFLANKNKIFNEYSLAEYVEENVSIDKAFKVARQYSTLEKLAPELIAGELSEAASAEVKYKRKSMLDTAIDAPKDKNWKS